MISLHKLQPYLRLGWPPILPFTMRPHQFIRWPWPYSQLYVPQPTLASGQREVSSVEWMARATVMRDENKATIYVSVGEEWLHVQVATY